MAPILGALRARRLVDAGQPPTRIARDLGMPRAVLCRRIRDLPTIV
ncbi:MAG: hypothetical protein ACOC84_01225 [Actinomycetota bacterium]